MSSSRSLSALLTAAVLALAGIASVSAQDRCEGTLCDFYYNTIRPAQPPAPKTAQQSQQPQPGQQPQAAPPTAGRPLVGVQGGGVVGLLQGRAPQRCTGTLCDLYYGGPPPEEPAAQPAAAAPAAPAAEAEIDAPAAAASRGAEPREAERHCAASAHDPWSCYR